MKTKSLVKFLVTFSVTIVTAVGIAIACGGYDEEYFGSSDFSPEPYVDEPYIPMMYTSGDMFYGIGYLYNYADKFNDDIVKDWKNFIKGGMNDADISFLLIDEKGGPIVSDLYTYLSKKVKIGIFPDWEYKVNLNNNEVKAFIEFLYYAKQVEKYTLASFDYFDSEQPALELVPASVVAQIKAKYQSASDPFIKNRYWFQTIKAYFYSESKREAIAFFNNTKKDAPQNTLYYRALSYIAGIEYKSKNFAQSNYLYSVVFAKCPAMRNTAVYCFHPQEEADWNQSLAMAQNADEKIALWALLGYYADEERSINEIYKLNPKSAHLDYLLTRLINKIEEKVSRYTDEAADKYKSESKNLLSQKDLSTVVSIAQAQNTSKPYFWNLVAGYLQTLNGEFQQARTFYNNASKQLPTGQIYKDQLRLLGLINNLSETTVMDAAAENKLLADLNWLYYELPKTAKQEFRYNKATHWCKYYISSLYKNQNNKVFAQLFRPADVYYHNSDNLELLKTFLEKPNKTAFEEFAEKIFPISVGAIYEYQSVMATFDNNIETAYAYMQKATGCNEDLLKANPFNGFIKDCHDCEHAMAQKTKYSKLRFVEIIKIMQEKLQKGEEVFNNNLLLGNAFYNITFYGNARVFYEGSIIGTEIGTISYVDDFYKTKLVNMDNAKYYYVAALKAATNNEQKAKCHYMLAKCERNEYYNQNGMTSDPWNNNKLADFLAWTGFKKLQSQYSTTKYYQEVIKECGYFATYLGK